MSWSGLRAADCSCDVPRCGGWAGSSQPISKPLRPIPEDAERFQNEANCLIALHCRTSLKYQLWLSVVNWNMLLRALENGTARFQRGPHQDHEVVE